MIELDIWIPITAPTWTKPLIDLKELLLTVQGYEYSIVHIDEDSLEEYSRGIIDNLNVTISVPENCAEFEFSGTGMINGSTVQTEIDSLELTAVKVQGIPAYWLDIISATGYESDFIKKIESR